VKLVKLDNSFYKDNAHLKEALDNHGGNWTSSKVRGYGIVVIKINNLTFAIPLRSNIRHKASYIVKRNTGQGGFGKGLDYSKALLITNRSYILSNEPFMIPPDEHKRLSNKGAYIRSSFEKYVYKYIAAVKKNDQNILRSNLYRYSTLQNYHRELGC
jgi:protein AbiQ